MRNFVFLLFALISIYSCASTSNQEIVIAEIGNQKLLSNELAARFTRSGEFKQTGWNDIEVIKNFINEELAIELMILQHAEDINLKEDSAIKVEIDNIKQKILLDRNGPLFKKRISSHVDVSISDLKELHKKLENKYKIAQITLKDKKIADSVYKLLEDGADFTDMVNQYSVNQNTANKDGIVGFFSWDHPSLPEEFKEKAFVLEQGKFTEPIEINNVYYIAQVVEIAPYEEIKPFEQDSSRLRQLIYRNRLTKQVHKYIDNLKEQGSISYSEYFDSVFQQKKEADSTFQFDLSDSTLFTDQERDQKIIEYKYGIYTVDELFNLFREKYPKMIRSYNSFDEFKERVTNNILTQELMYQDALTLDFTDSPEFTNQYNQMANSLIIKEMKDRFINDSIQVTEEERKVFYEKNQYTLYKIDSQMTVRMIMSTKESDIKDAYKRVKSGEDFGKVAQELSEDITSKSKNGFLGNVNKDDNRWKFLVDPLRKTGFNQVIEPVKHNDKYFIALKTADMPQKIRSYKSVKRRINQEIINIRKKQYQEKYFGSLKEKYSITILEDNLKKFINSLKNTKSK